MEWGSNGCEARDRASGIDWRVTMLVILPDQDAYGHTDGAVNIRSNTHSKKTRQPVTHLLREQIGFIGRIPRAIAQSEELAREFRSTPRPIFISLLLLPHKTLSITHDVIAIPTHSSYTNNSYTYTLFLLSRSTDTKLQYLSAQEGVLERIFTAPSV